VDKHGLLLIDKPEGITSHDVVASVRKILRQKRVGHTGTLDPIATGLMIVVLGEATKLSDYLLNEDKGYRVTVRLGVRTDTLDRSGKILEEKPADVPRAEIVAAAAALEGEFDWAVPAFSAVKVDGKKLYEQARKNADFETPVKTMSFWGVSVVEAGPDRVTVDLNCSKGSFIRTWAEKLGEKLGTGAMVEELRRTRIGEWKVEQAVTLEHLAPDPEPGSALISLNEALPGFRSVTMDSREARLMGHGQIPRSLAGRLIPEQKQAFETQAPIFVKVVSGAGELLALLGAEPGQGLKIRRVFRP